WQFQGFGCSPYDYVPCWWGLDPWYYWPKCYAPPPGGTSAHVSVKLPADARLFVDDDPCPLPGAARALDTPDLQPGVTYKYTIRAEVTRDGKTVKQSKRVTVKAGEETVVDFGDMRGGGSEEL